MKMRVQHNGFTLIELMIVVAVVGILAAIAYPSYREQIQKSRRADAQSVLMQSAQFMERVYSETGCYNPGADNACGNADDGSPGLPHAKSPIDGADNHYGIAFAAAGLNATSYTLQATPTAGGSQAGTGVLQLNNLGQKFWDENNDNDVLDTGEDDWERG